MSFDLDMFFVDWILLVVSMALAISLSRFMGRLFRTQFPVVFRVAGRIERRHPALFDGGDTFYCFFRKAALYGE